MAGVAGTSTAHPGSLAGEFHGGPGPQIVGSLQGYQQQGIVVISPDVVGRHAGYFRGRPLNLVCPEAGWQIPMHGQGEADRSRVFPVSMVAGADFLVDSDGKFLSWLDRRGFADKGDLDWRDFIGIRRQHGDGKGEYCKKEGV